jgi:phosphoribosylformimino-5-aminoimidazole carboxamide ribotide isomerase
LTTLIPAVDIRGGRAVRLVQGDYERETAFDTDPADAARRWASGGAEVLHVIDLDGAKAGEPQNVDALRRICAAVDVPVQFGGGLRTAESIAMAFEAGAERAVLGTVAITDPALLETAVAERPGAIVASVDARAGRVAVEAWSREAEIGPAELLRDLVPRGVSRFLYTPVEVDGTLEGPSLDALRPVAEAAADAGAGLLYSGGVGELQHLRQLAALALPALEGVVVGRALYDGRFTLAEGQAALALASR